MYSSDDFALPGMRSRLLIETSPYESRLTLSPAEGLMSGIPAGDVSLTISSLEQERLEHAQNQIVWSISMNTQAKTTSLSQARAYLKSLDAAVAQAEQWESLSRHVNADPLSCANELIKLAKADQWERIIILLAVLPTPLATLPEKSKNGLRDEHDNPIPNLASVLFADPVFGVAKAVFIDYAEGRTESSLSKHAEKTQLYIRVYLTLLNRLMCCYNDRSMKNTGYLLASYLLERTDLAEHHPALMQSIPKIVLAGGSTGAPSEAVDLLRRARDCKHDVLPL